MTRTTSTIRFKTRLLRPAAPARASWTFLLLPAEASAKLPTRGQAAVDGTLNGQPFQAVLEPDGQGGHWLKVPKKLGEAAGAAPGEAVAMEIRPAAKAPEPKVPPDLRKALAAAGPATRATWSDITPAARRDWIHWITSARRAETRARRIGNACDMLANGKRRVCCFDRSGIYSGEFSAPPEAESPVPRAPRAQSSTAQSGSGSASSLGRATR